MPTIELYIVVGFSFYFVDSIITGGSKTQKNLNFSYIWLFPNHQHIER
jgi:hypothetical protein